MRISNRPVELPPEGALRGTNKKLKEYGDHRSNESSCELYRVFRIFAEVLRSNSGAIPIKAKNEIFVKAN